MGLDHVLDNYCMAQREHNMLRIEPLVVLDRLACILEEVLGDINLHGMPDVQIGSTALR